MSDCRIYVACLAAYNNGKHHGAWIDVPDDTDELGEAIEAMLAKSPEPDAEEWAIHDHEGFPRTMGENPDLDKLCAYARLVNEHGEAFEDYISDILGWDYFDADTVEDGFHDAYNGHWASEREFAEHQVDEGLFGPIPDSALANYIDYDAIARDLFCGDYVMSDNRHVFCQC